MPHFCAVYKCTNRSNREKDKKFFGFPGVRDRRGRDLPEGVKRRILWMEAICREDLTEEKLPKASVCSDHFLSGYPAPDSQVNHPDYVPNQRLGYISGSSMTTTPVGRYKGSAKRRRKCSSKAEEEVVIRETEEATSEQAGNPEGSSRSNQENLKQ